MKKAVVCFFVFVITGLSSAFLGVSGDMTFAIGAISALLYLVFSRKKKDSNRGRNSSSSYSSSSSHVYSTKKYSSEDVARLLSSGNLYACRFEDGSNMTRIDAVTRAKIIIRGGDQYMEIPERLGGTYKLLHGHSHTLKGGICYINVGGDNWYLMDYNKNIILY